MKPHHPFGFATPSACAGCFGSCGRPSREDGPGGRARGPDRHLRLAELRIVEAPGAHADIMTPRFGLGENRRPAGGAEVPVHLVAALGLARIVGERAFDLHRFACEEHVHRAGARADILAVPAPAMPREQRLRLDPVAHRAAAASSGDGHVFLPHFRVAAARSLPPPRGEVRRRADMRDAGVGSFAPDPARRRHRASGSASS